MSSRKILRVTVSSKLSVSQSQSALRHSRSTKFPSVQHDKLRPTSICVRRPSSLELTARTFATNHFNRTFQARSKNVFLPAETLETFLLNGLFIYLLTYLLTYCLRPRAGRLQFLCTDSARSQSPPCARTVTLHCRRSTELPLSPGRCMLPAPGGDSAADRRRIEGLLLRGVLAGYPLPTTNCTTVSSTTVTTTAHRRTDSHPLRDRRHDFQLSCRSY